MLKRTLGCLVFMLIPAVIGMWFGLKKADRMLLGVDNPWTSVSLPQGVLPFEFVQGEGSMAYIRASDGSLFLHELEDFREPSWIVIEEIVPGEMMDVRIAAGRCQPVPVGPHPKWGVEPPPTTLAQLNCSYPVNSGYIADFVFVILEDGNVQRWERHDPGLGGLGILIIYAGKGMISGAVPGLLLFLIIIWIHQRGVTERRRYTPAGLSPPAQGHDRAEDVHDLIKKMDND